MATSHCCVPNCTNTGGHRFPRNEKLKHRWILAIRRVMTTKGGKDWQPKKFSTVCREHFLEENYLSTNKYGIKPLVRRLKQGSVPSLFSWCKEGNTTSEREVRLGKRHREDGGETLLSLTEASIGAEEEIETLEEHACLLSNMLLHAATQTDQTGPATIFSISHFTRDPDGIQFFTGLPNYEAFQAVFYSLGDCVNKLEYFYPLSSNNFSSENLLFIVLIKLRQAKTNFELSRMFSISKKDVYSIIVTWIRFLGLQWTEIDLWPSKNLVNFYLPLNFKIDFPATRIIIDGTEIAIKKPKQPFAQQVTFSKYKNRNTAKVLIGATPGGLVSFVSPVYGGSASDRQIVERSMLPSMCDPKDSVMADKGFDVQDIFASYDVTVNIPTFFRKKNRMNLSTVLRDRKISSKRVHIERIIGLGKTFKILQKPLNNTETELSDDIVFICFMLCNFRNNIMSTKV